MVADALTGTQKTLVWRDRKRPMRRILSTEVAPGSYLIVVLDEMEDLYWFRSAYPANSHYFEACVTGRGILIDVWDTAQPPATAMPLKRRYLPPPRPLPPSGGRTADKLVPSGLTHAHIRYYYPYIAERVETWARKKDACRRSGRS
jgi:hypothetical protein